MILRVPKATSRPAASLLLIALLTGLLPGSIQLVRAAAGDTTRVSVDSSGVQANSDSSWPAISADGRYVVFESDALNLVAADSNGQRDIFMHDGQTGATTLISVDSSGTQANGDSYSAAISAAGRYVAFTSEASNLVSGDINTAPDIFVHDTQTGATTRVSVDSSGAQADGESGTPDISSDGRYVVFSSTATNLVGGDTNGVRDVFMNDSQTGATSRLSVDSSGAQADGASANPVISDDGRYAAFTSTAANLVSGDTNALQDVFLHDRQTGATTRVSLTSSGTQADKSSDEPAISGDGRFVSFSSTALLIAGDPSYLEYRISLYLHDNQTGEITRASLYSDGTPMLGDSTESSLSADGRFVTFTFDEYGDGACVEIVVMHDRITGYEHAAQPRVSLDCADSIFSSSVSANGQLIAFVTGSDDIVLGDTNGAYDVFVHEDLDEPGTPAVASISRASPNPSDGPSVDFTVTFSEAVYGVETGDFSLTTTGSLSGASITNIAGLAFHETRTVTVNTGTGDGTIRLDLTDDDSIQDVMLNPLGGTGAGNGNFTTGEVYTLDRNNPSVTAITRADPDPTSADSVNFIVTFSEPVSGVDASDFQVDASSPISGAGLTNVSGSGSSYTVSATTGNGDGTIRLDLLDDDSITDSAGHPLGGTGAGNGAFNTGESYRVDHNNPFVQSSLRVDPNPTSAPILHFTVTFSEPVSGVDLADFALTTSGNLTSSSVANVSGSDAIYTVTVNTGSWNGNVTLRLDVLDNDSIMDSFDHPLGGTGAGNGAFTSGDIYTIPGNNLPIKSYTFRSNGASDGWLLESSEDSNQGGSKNTRANTIGIGDDAQDRQSRAILHFPTQYLPDDAILISAILTLKKESVIGADPFSTHGNIVVDIKRGPFGSGGFLGLGGTELSDFQAPASMESAGAIQNNPVDGFYWTLLDPAALQFINPTGVTQLRLRFQTDDNDDLGADVINFYSGNDGARLVFRPRLVVKYSVPW